MSLENHFHILIRPLNGSRLPDRNYEMGFGRVSRFSTISTIIRLSHNSQKTVCAGNEVAREYWQFLHFSQYLTTMIKCTTL